MADPGQLEAIARRIRAEAKQLHNALDPLTQAAASAAWRGNAADMFRADVKKDGATLKSAAAALEALAAALERGADEVRRKREQIRRALQKEVERQREAATAGGRRP